MKRKRRLLIDTDTASDDAVALIMALGRLGIEVLGVTVLAGNVPARSGTCRRSSEHNVEIETVSELTRE